MLRKVHMQGLPGVLLALAAAFAAGCSNSDVGSQPHTLPGALNQLPEVTSQVSKNNGKSPNVLLVVLDDIGFTDLGTWGGAIDTPNLNTLALEGMVLTNFHTAPTCAPTRAMLLSGMDNHIAGLGSMAAGDLADNQKGKPGYEEYLNFQVAALPELLLDAGYHTYMTGKWHLGLTKQTSPTARGFERSFALLNGGAGAFSNMLPIVGPGKAKYREDGKLLDKLPDNFYSTAFYTQRMIEYIDSNRADGRPFFAYLAYTSAHWPLQAPQESIARYHGKFNSGYDSYRAERLTRLKELGYVSTDVEAFPRLPGQPDWNELSDEQKMIEARKMEIYAAMIDDVDHYLGQLVAHLKDIGEYQNTFVFVMADNGPEGHELDAGWPALSDWVKNCCDNSYDNMGRANSYVWYGPNWAQAGNTPFRMYKGFTSQGGVNVPAFAHFPKLISGDRSSNALVDVMDVMPTILDLAGIEHPGAGSYKGREVVAMQGTSLVPLLQGTRASAHDENYAIGWELLGKRGLRKGNWKILYEPGHKIQQMRPEGIKADTWQLYNLSEDPNELNDLSERYLDKRDEMIASWEAYARKNNVILPDSWGSY